jgi:hypothetical protein
MNSNIRAAKKSVRFLLGLLARQRLLGPDQFTESELQHAALSLDAAEMLQGGWSLPQPLLEHACEVLTGNKAPKPPKQGVSFKGRDAHLATIVKLTAERYGLNKVLSVATRSKHPARRSACGIVAEVLKEFDVNLKERTIEDIWHRSKDRLVDIPLVSLPLDDVKRIARQGR